MTLDHSLKLYKKPNLRHPFFLLGWSKDVGALGAGVIDFVNASLKTEQIGEVEAKGFFSLSGVAIEEDVIQFPQSNFYCSEERNLIIFKSDLPVLEQYRFLNSTLDAAKYFKAKEIYTIGGIISLRAHTAPRRISGVVNKEKLKSMLAEYGLKMNMDYRTPPGERPTLSSFLLWMAKTRNIPTVNLWGEVPFYLGSAFDARAGEHVLDFLNRRLSLNMDLTPLQEESEEQSGMIGKLRGQKPEVGKCIEMLERGIMLGPEESEKLRSEVMKILSRR